MKGGNWLYDFDSWFDLKRALKMDEEISRNRKIKWKTLLVFLFVTACSTGSLLLGLKIPVMLCFAAAGLLLVLMLIQNLGNTKRYVRLVYEPGDTSPAIVVHTEPLIVYALGNLDYTEENNIYSLRWFELKDITGQKREIGERVPCAAMFEESRQRSQFRRFRIHPYCWATDRDGIIQEKNKEIGEKEWALPTDACRKYGTLDKWEILELKADGTPICRHYDTSDKIAFVASEELEMQYPKGMYPVILMLSEEDDKTRLYRRFAQLAVEKKVYEYVGERDEADYMITIYNNPGEFAKQRQEGNLPLDDDEIPLIFGHGLITNKGAWWKKEFTPWKEVRLTIGKARLSEKLPIFINGKCIARPLCRSTYYQPVPSPELVYALEEKHMREFFLELKNGALEHEDKRKDDQSIYEEK